MAVLPATNYLLLTTYCLLLTTYYTGLFTAVLPATNVVSCFVVGYVCERLLATAATKEGTKVDTTAGTGLFPTRVLIPYTCSHPRTM